MVPMFYCSMLLSRLGDQVLLFLVPLVVYQITHSSALTGWAFFVETLARFAAFPVCGILSDRYPPLSLIRHSQTGRAAACALVLPLWFWQDSLPTSVTLGILVLVSAVVGVLTTQGFIAREVLLPRVFAAPVQEGRSSAYGRVAAHTQIADQVGMVLGPIVAAAALVWVPWPMVVLGAAVLFVLADACLLVWRKTCGPLADLSDSPASTAPPQHDWWSSMRTALRHVMHLPHIRPLIVLTAGINLMLGITQASVAAMFTGQLGQDAHHYALLQTAGAVSTIVVLAWMARSQWRGEHRAGMLSYACVLFGGLLTLMPHPLAYACGFVLVLGFDKMFGIYIRIQRLHIIPPQDFGKTSGVIVLLNNLSQPLAGAALGLFAHGADARPVIAVLCGAAAVMAIAWISLHKEAVLPTHASK